MLGRLKLNREQVTFEESSRTCCVFIPSIKWITTGSEILSSEAAVNEARKSDRMSRNIRDFAGSSLLRERASTLRPYDGDLYVTWWAEAKIVPRLSRLGKAA